MGTAHQPRFINCHITENLMTRKEALFAVIGGVVGAVLVMAAGLVLATRRAQNEVRDANFGSDNL